MEYISRTILTVTQLTEEIRKTLESEFPSVWVQGEISNCKRAPSGHFYFTLKDDASQIRCVMFKNQNKFLKFKIEDGLKALAWGRINVYSPRGEYQLIVETLEPAGLGGLMLALEQLKAKLTEEGLFDLSRKKTLPRRPENVGVVTSASGAAVRDIIRIIRRRSPGINILLSPTSVQGDKAPDEIVQALGRLVRLGTSEVIIIGRGGGSIEDLWAFNDERVVRAIASCPIPIVSAVGHETDFTLSDLAADIRASTPSAAAEIVAPDDNETWDTVSHLTARLRNAITNCLERNYQTLDDLTRAFQRPLRRIQEARFRLEDFVGRMRISALRSMNSSRRDVEAIQARLRPELLRRSLVSSSESLVLLSNRLERATRASLDEYRNRLNGLAAQLDALSPFRVLSRGYSITFRKVDDSVVSEIASVTEGDEIKTLVSDGEIVSRVILSRSTPWDSPISKE
ncbi:MAG: exodeoxyribonuclease VII large subunit [Desulfomonilaceae bacterium]